MRLVKEPSLSLKVLDAHRTKWWNFVPWAPKWRLHLLVMWEWNPILLIRNGFWKIQDFSLNESHMRHSRKRLKIKIFKKFIFQFFKTRASIVNLLYFDKNKRVKIWNALMYCGVVGLPPIKREERKSKRRKEREFLSKWFYLK